MQSIKRKISSWYHQLDGVFAEEEAWEFFKLSAILETFGWAMLTTGIIFKVNEWPAYGWVLALGGSFHGVLVMIYVAVVLFTHRSLGWSLKKCLVAVMINAIPFAVLFFEIYVARERTKLKSSIK